MVPLACWVVGGSGAIGVPVVVVRRCCSSLGALLSFMSLLGSRWRSLGSRLLGAGCCCFLCVQLSRCWAVVVVLGAGLVHGGVGCVTWHAGDMEGASVVVDAGDVAVWLSDLFVRQ